MDYFSNKIVLSKVTNCQAKQAFLNLHLWNDHLFPFLSRFLWHSSILVLLLSLTNCCSGTRLCPSRLLCTESPSLFDLYTIVQSDVIIIRGWYSLCTRFPDLSSPSLSAEPQSWISNCLSEILTWVFHKLPHIQHVNQKAFMSTYYVPGGS